MYREGVDKRSMLIRMVAVLKTEAGSIYTISLPNSYPIANTNSQPVYLAQILVPLRFIPI